MPFLLRVLIVEDAPDDCELMVATLRQAGYRPLYERVDTAEGMRTALLQHRWDLIIADFSMPSFSGAEALELATQMGCDIPFILVSGTVSDEVAIGVMRAGANDYLSKDNLARLGPAVERELRDAETRRAKRRAEASLRFLADASAALAESIEYEPTIARVAKMAVPFFAEACAVDLWEEGKLVRVAFSHADPARADILAQSSGHASLTEHVARTGAPLLVADVAAQESPSPIGPESAARLSSLGISSLISVPLSNAGQTIGAMGFGAARKRYDAADLVLAQELGRRSALAIQNARLFRTTAEAIRRRDEFIAIAAHELRTPLTPVRLQIQGIQRLVEGDHGSALAAELRPRVTMATRQVQRLASLVETLLDVSRVMREKLELQPATVDLHAIVLEAADRLAADATRRGSSIAVHGDGPLVGTWDGARLDQVVTNLLSNAIRYGSGRPIEVTLENGADFARVRVRDHGIGIPHADLARIFERFERAVSGRNFGGLGIGLWISRCIVEAHGGFIEVESQPNQGSTFTVLLPKRPFAALREAEADATTDGAATAAP